MIGAPRRWDLSVLLLACLASAAIIGVARLAIGPADLYEKDQPKTLAYTADLLLHGRWALPRDVIYQPATKPPLYNWMAAAIIGATGSWGELAMKSPSVIGAVGVGALLVWADPRRWWVGTLAAAMWFAYGVEPRHGSVMRLMFLARPDMLQAFFLTGAWLAATRAVAPLAGARPARIEPAIFWACVMGAILTKGPMALLAIAYAVVAAPLLGGSWRSLARLWPVLGSAATALCVGAWFACAWRTDADHVRGVMLGAEIVGRVSEQTPEGIRKPAYTAMMWFVTKGGPFSLLALGMVLVTARRWREAGPMVRAATLWLIVLLLGLSLPAGKRIDYLLPTFAPAAWLAAWALVATCHRLRLPLALAGLLPLGMSLVLARAHLTKFHESVTPLSDRAVAFAREVRARVKDDEPLLVIVRGKHPLPTLLHRHQGSYLTTSDLSRSRWIILPLTETLASPVLRSDLLPMGFETIQERPLAVLGLFDMTAADAPTPQELTAAQQHVGEWTTAENPYRSPGTVWRE